MGYFFIISSTLALCFTAQLLALRASGGRPAKNESNFFSSLGRIQSGAVSGPEVMFLGSSLTGRLPDHSSGFPGIANMGCDGGSAIDALRAMERGILPTAPIVVIEVNSLGRALDPTPSEVGLALEGLWFKAGMRFPVLSAYARPSGFFYSPLLERRIGAFNEAAGPEDLGVASRPRPAEMPPDVILGPAERALIVEVAGIVQNLRERGSRVIFLWLPPNRRDGSPFPAWLSAMAAESGSEYWDLGGEADAALISLTDGAHMDAPSAARTVRSVIHALDLQPSMISE